MSDSEALKSLLLHVRQHPAFQELLRKVERPRPARYRPSKNDDVPSMGARAIYASGQMAQDEIWRFVLTGVPQSGEE